MLFLREGYILFQNSSMVAWYKVLDFTFVFWRGIWRGSFLQKCFRTSIFPMTILNLCGRPLLLFIVCVSWGRDFESVHCSSLSIYGSARDRRCLVNTSWKLIKIIYTRWACFIYACFMDCVTFSSIVNWFCQHSLFIYYDCDSNSCLQHHFYWLHEILHVYKICNLPL